MYKFWTTYENALIARPYGQTFSVYFTFNYRDVYCPE